MKMISTIFRPESSGPSSDTVPKISNFRTLKPTETIEESHFAILISNVKVTAGVSVHSPPMMLHQLTATGHSISLYRHSFYGVRDGPYNYNLEEA